MLAAGEAYSGHAAMVGHTCWTVLENVSSNPCEHRSERSSINLSRVYVPVCRAIAFWLSCDVQQQSPNTSEVAHKVSCPQVGDTQDTV